MRKLKVLGQILDSGFVAVVRAVHSVAVGGSLTRAAAGGDMQALTALAKRFLEEGAPMTKKIVTFGETLLRLAPPGFERFLQSPQLTAVFGGAEANVAVALASFGMDVSYVTVLPEDNPIADAALAELRRFAVDTSRIVRRPGRLGTY
jgi:pfkB family carbohydrate kinase